MSELFMAIGEPRGVSPRVGVLVQRPTESELERLRQSVQRGCPHGAAPWLRQTASDLGLDATLRNRGRPRKRHETERHPAVLFEEE